MRLVYSVAPSKRGLTDVGTDMKRCEAPCLASEPFEPATLLSQSGCLPTVLCFPWLPDT